MKIKLVDRAEVRTSKRSSSKFRPLIEALNNLQAGGQAIEVGYANDKELSSIRNIVYTYNREGNHKIKSGKDAVNGKLYFFRDK